MSLQIWTAPRTPDPANPDPRQDRTGEGEKGRTKKFSPAPFPLFPILASGPRDPPTPRPREPRDPPTPRARSSFFCVRLRRMRPRDAPPGLPLLIAAALLLAPILAAFQAAPGPRLRSIAGVPATGVARAVVVEAGSLVHTALMFPEDQEGRLQGGTDAGGQAARVLANIELALLEARTTLEHLVRL